MLSAWKACCMPIQQRWVFAIMGFLAIVNAYTMRNCLSIAITQMVVSGDNNSTSLDETCSSSETTTNTTSSTSGIYEWDEYTQGIILSSFYWGYVVTHLPGAMLAEKFGGKYTLGIGMLSTAIFTLLTPYAVSLGGSTALIVLRSFMGLGEGTTFPALSTMLAQWTPPQERSKIGSLVFAGAQIGTVVASSLSGVLISYSAMGWPVVFYVFGGIGVLWFLIWVFICYSTPDDHPFISDNEKKFLHEALGAHTHKNAPLVPWRHMLRSVPLWALVCAQAGHDWGFYTMVTDLPTYMSSVLKFSIGTNGLLSALPYLCMWLCSIATSWLTDWVITSGYMSTGNIRKLMTTIASVGPAAFIIAASYTGCDKVVAVAFFTIGMTFMGPFYPGMRVNVLDLSPNYSGSIIALTNGVGAIAGIVAPYVVGVLTPNQTLSEWRLVFWIVAGIFLVTNAVYVIWASGEVQYWNDPTFLIQDKQDRQREAANVKLEKASKQ